MGRRFSYQLYKDRLRSDSSDSASVSQITQPFYGSDDNTQKNITLGAKVFLSSLAAAAESLTDYWLVWAKNIRQVHGRTLRRSIAQCLPDILENPKLTTVQLSRRYLRGTRDLCMGTVPFVVALELKQNVFDKRIGYQSLYTDLAMNTLLGATLINAVEKLRVGSVYSSDRLAHEDFSRRFIKDIALGKTPFARLFDGALATGVRDGASMTAAICGLDHKIARLIRKWNQPGNTVEQAIRDQDAKILPLQHQYQPFNFYYRHSESLGKISAAFLGTVISHPADVIGTKAQVYSFQGKTINYFALAKDLWHEGGVRLWTRGLFHRFTSLLALNVFFNFYKNKLNSMHAHLTSSFEESRNCSDTGAVSRPYYLCARGIWVSQSPKHRSEHCYNFESEQVDESELCDDQSLLEPYNWKKR